MQQEQKLKSENLQNENKDLLEANRRLLGENKKLLAENKKHLEVQQQTESESSGQKKDLLAANKRLLGENKKLQAEKKKHLEDLNLVQSESEGRQHRIDQLEADMKVLHSEADGHQEQIGKLHEELLGLKAFPNQGTTCGGRPFTAALKTLQEDCRKLCDEIASVHTKAEVIDGAQSIRRIVGSCAMRLHQVPSHSLAAFRDVRYRHGICLCCCRTFKVSKVVERKSSC